MSIGSDNKILLIIYALSLSSAAIVIVIPMLKTSEIWISGVVLAILAQEGEYCDHHRTCFKILAHGAAASACPHYVEVQFSILVVTWHL
jgi:hypothetical protein